MINTLIEKYKIIRLIGKGGMAKVYEANHIKLRSRVAIKILNEELVKKTNIRQRFENEARIMAELHHPNIVNIIDYIENSTMLAIVMEYLEGYTLTDYIKNAKPSKNQIIQIFSQVLSAFNLAHQKGIIHRDIKPSNIFIETKKNNNVKILDFGIAKLITSDLSLTQTGTQMGSPLYMSPEQVKDASDIDNLSDIYSLGVVLYYMVTGQPPYNDPTLSKFDIFNKIVYETLPSLTEYSEFNRIIQKATQKKKIDRYVTCQEFLTDLLSITQTNTSKPLLPQSDKSKLKKQPSKKTTSQNKKIVAKKTTSIAKKKVSVAKKTTSVKRKQKKKKKSATGIYILLVSLLLIVLFLIFKNDILTDKQYHPKMAEKKSGTRTEKIPQNEKRLKKHPFEHTINNFNGQAVAETSKNDYLIVGKDQANVSTIYKLSGNGKKSEEYLSVDFTVSDISNEHSNYIIGGTKNNELIIKKYNRKKSIWDKSFSEYRNPKITKVFTDKKNNYLIIGYTKIKGTREDVFIIKLDATGNVINKKKFGSKKKDIIYDVAETSTGYFFIGEADNQIWVLVTDRNLNKKKNDDLGFGRKASSIVNINSDYYVVGEKFLKNDINIFLMKFNSEGSKKWHEPIIFGDKDSFELKPRISDINGQLLIAFTSTIDNNSKVQLLKYDLKEKKNIEYNPIKNTELKDLIKCSDGGNMIEAKIANENKTIVKLIY